MVDDELADVNLEGIELVSDNPKDWQLPVTMGAFDSVYDWWQHLHKAETIHPPVVTHLFAKVIDSYSLETGVHRNCDSVLYQAVEQLVELGFSLADLCELFSLSRRQLLGQFADVWTVLENGTLDDARRAFPKMSVPHLRRIHTVLNGGQVRRAMPTELRVEAQRLVASGLSLRETAEVLTGRYGRSISKAAVAAWIHRARKANQ